jgi:TolB protein
MKQNGTDKQQVTHMSGVAIFPDFSPDGSKIVFTSNRTGISQVWVMDANGGNQTQLTFDPQPKDQVPDWSPNGRKIAYLADTHGISDVVSPSWGDIWVMNADGSGQHPITHDATDYGTAWSPDGTRIATLDFPSRTIYTLNASDGSHRQAVHPAGLQFVPAWQPHGTGSDDEAD